jgi:nucleoid-associated protein YgaU
MERLDKLALDFYNDGSLWWVIAAANGLGKGTLVVQPNTRLRIPSETGVQDRIQQANKQR